MADDYVDSSVPVGKVSTESVTNVNGATVTEREVQRVTLATVSGVTATDLGATNPLPIVDIDASTTGSITAADAVVAAPAGDGTLRTGASTAGSIVSMPSPGGDSSWLVQLTGTFGGTTVYFESSADSTNGTDGNWVNVNGRRTGEVNTTLLGGATAAGVYRGNCAGSKYCRVRAVGGAGITIAVVLRMGAGSGAMFLNASIPAGTNIIGTTQEVPRTSGGNSTYSFLSTAAVQAAAIKASAGQFYGLHFFNLGAAAVYVRIYNKATSPLTSDTPIWRGVVPGNAAGAGFVIPVTGGGVACSLGIGIRVTGAVADNDATALSANAVIGNVIFT